MVNAASNVIRTRSQQRIRGYGEWACVTGASSGIGLEFARRLAEAGVHLVLVARRREVLETHAAEWARVHGIQTRIVAADLNEREACGRVIDACDGIDVGLVVCAAGFGSSGPFIESSLQEELSMVDVNCRAVTELSWHFAKRFVERAKQHPGKRGGIVLLSSLLAFQGVAKAANYAATKAYVQSLAEGLHHELKGLGVDVLASAPGPIHSGFASRAKMKLGFAQTPRDVAKATLDAIGRRTTVRPGWLSKALEWSLKPLPRWGRVRMMGVVMGGMAGKAPRA